MVVARARRSTDILTRIGLWFGSLILSISLFTVLFGLLSGSPTAFAFRATPFAFRIAMTFAFPVWCLCLPFVIAFKGAEKRRLWILLMGGTLIGPASLALWCLMLQLRGDDPHTIWYGDPLAGIGGIACTFFALIVGFLATSIYLASLRILRRSSTTARA
jgi:hypothetical protein